MAVRLLGEEGSHGMGIKKRTDRKTFCSVVGVRELHPQQDSAAIDLFVSLLPPCICLSLVPACLVAAIICLPRLLSESDCTHAPNQDT